jgi:hypothetical protein
MMSITDTENERIAREHFEADQHEGPLVTCYSIGENDYLIAARPQKSLGHRLHRVVTASRVDESMLDYVGSLIHNFTFADLLTRDLEVFEGEVN